MRVEKYEMRVEKYIRVLKPQSVWKKNSGRVL